MSNPNRLLSNNTNPLLKKRNEGSSNNDSEISPKRQCIFDNNRQHYFRTQATNHPQEGAINNPRHYFRTQATNRPQEGAINNSHHDFRTQATNHHQPEWSTLNHSNNRSNSLQTKQSYPDILALTEDFCKNDSNIQSGRNKEAQDSACKRFFERTYKYLNWDKSPANALQYILMKLEEEYKNSHQTTFISKWKEFFRYVSVLITYCTENQHNKTACHRYYATVLHRLGKMAINPRLTELITIIDSKCIKTLVE